jgi:hypothetical protein
MLLGTLVVLLLVIDCGIVAGLLRGGRLGSLRAARVKALPLLVAALALQLLLGLPWGHGHGSRWGIGSVLLVVSLLALLIVVWANAQLPGMPLIGLGLLANLLVVSVNGAMPRRLQPRRPTSTVPAPRWLTSVPNTWLQGPRPACRCSALGSGSSAPGPRSVSAISSSTPAWFWSSKDSWFGVPLDGRRKRRRAALG